MVTISRNRALQKDAPKERKPRPERKGGGRARAGKTQREQNKSDKKGKANFVLFVGDEGAILTYTSGLHVQRRLFAPTPSPEHTENLRALLDTDANAPIYLLLDSMDQAYQRHSLPPVASVSLNKIVRRRLHRDFAADDIKGALQIGREEGGRRDWNYLLVAVSSTGAVAQWMDLCLDRDNPFKGIYLSPVESETFIARMTQTLGSATEIAPETGKSKKRSKTEATYPWQLLVSHHKVGGFRLVVLHKGRLAFTRLAQPIGETTPEVVAGNVEHEVLNTIEYMKRLGYQEGQPLQVLVLVAPDIKQQLDQTTMPAQDVHFFTPYEAAGLLGLQAVAQPEDHYADVLQSVHLLAAKKHRLILHSPVTARLSALANGAKAAYAAAALAGLALIGFGLWQGWQGMQMGSEIIQMQTQLNAERESAARAETEMKKFPETIQTMLDVSRLYQTYGSKQTYILPTSLMHAEALTHQDFVLSEVKWTRIPAAAPVPESLSILLKGEVIKSVKDTVSSLRVRLNQILAEAKNQYPDSNVGYTDLPELFSDKSDLKTSIGGDAENDALQRVLAQPLKVGLKIESPKKETTGGAP